MVGKLRSLLILLTGIGLAYWFVSQLEWHIVGAHMRSMRWWPLAGAAIMITLTMFVRALRWQTLLAPISPVRLHNTFAATAIGFGGIFIFGRAGEVVRPVMLSLREPVPASATIATILIERIFDMTTVVLLFAINLLFFRLPVSRPDDAQMLTSIRTLGALLTLGVIIGVAALVLLRLNAAAFLSLLARWLRPLPEKLTRPLLNLVRHMADGLSVLVNWRELARAMFYSVCVWIMVAGATWLVAIAFHTAFPITDAIFVMGFGLVGSVVPTPGGSAGAFHKAAQVGLMFLGIEQNLAAAVAIIYHLIAFGTPFLIGLYYLVRDGISLGRLRELIAHESAVA